MQMGYVHAAWIVLGLADSMESNDFITNQLSAGKKRQLSS